MIAPLFNHLPVRKPLTSITCYCSLDFVEGIAGLSCMLWNRFQQRFLTLRSFRGCLPQSLKRWLLSTDNNSSAAEIIHLKRNLGEGFTLFISIKNGCWNQYKRVRGCLPQSLQKWLLSWDNNSSFAERASSKRSSGEGFPGPSLWVRNCCRNRFQQNDRPHITKWISIPKQNQ